MKELGRATFAVKNGILKREGLPGPGAEIPRMKLS